MVNYQLVVAASQTTLEVTDSIPILKNEKQVKILHIKSKPSFSTKHKSHQFENHVILKKSNKHIKDIKSTQSVRGRKIVAWILGGIAILLFIIYLICGLTMGGPLGAFIYLMGLPVSAVALAIVALIIRYAGIKKVIEREKNEPGKKVGKGFINAGFYLAIAGFILVIMAFIFSLITLYSLSYLMTLIFGVIGMIVALIALGFGINSILDDPSLKSKFTIIIAVLAIILAALAIVFMIIF